LVVIPEGDLLLSLFLPLFVLAVIPPAAKAHPHAVRTFSMLPLPLPITSNATIPATSPIEKTYQPIKISCLIGLLRDAILK
jgi:hypothetical protein